MMNTHPSTPTHLSPHRKALYILLPILLLTLILSYILISSQIKRSNEIRDEEQQFMTLKQDMLALQTEFNKIDKGWEYGEGCSSRDRLTNVNVAAGCMAGITNKELGAEQVRVVAEKYLSYLTQREKYVFVSPLSENSDTSRISLSREFRIKALNNMRCYFIAVSDYKGSVSSWNRDSVEVSCSGHAKGFYYKKL